MSRNIYWVAVQELPTKKDQDDNNALPRLVLQPTAVIARDDRHAASLAIMNNEEEIKKYDKNRLDVVVCPL